MKLLDKLKNALFEEEYVEVEEKPKKKTQNKVIKKELPKEKTEEKPIAKKIVLPERQEVKITNHEDVREEIEEEKIIEEEKKEYKFPMVSDNEFIVEETNKFEQPKVDYIVEQKEVKDNYKGYHQTSKQPKLYGIDDIPIPEPEYGTYEKKEDRTYFRPSPIISPIYGILDKNYKKEDVVPKREVRLTSSYSRENLDLDAVRNKAYGTLSNDIEDAINDSCTDVDREIEESNLMDQDLLDLRNDETTPEIKKVTVGDAEEYFNDLGLEYNVDYKDGGKEKATGRRCKDADEGQEDEEEFAPVIAKEEYEEKIANQEVKMDNDDIDDDNLFDLIDSMYEKE